MKTVRNTLLISLILAAAACTTTPKGTEHEALIQAGKAFYRQDYAEAYKRWLPLAKSGSAEAQNNLGTLYQQGQGVKQNYTQARYWFEQAAKQNFAAAYYNLGNLYAFGRGVPKDLKQAFHHYLHAAELSDADAQNEVGVMYIAGKGTAKNPKAARMWYERAAAQGHTMAQFNLASMLYKGTGGVKDERRALLLYQAVAEKGDHEAQYLLGVFYHNGDLGLPQDLEEARYWWQKAVASGSQEARIRLAGSTHPAAKTRPLRRPLNGYGHSSSLEIYLSGCLPYTQALAAGEAAVNLCLPEGREVMSDLAALLNKPPQSAPTHQNVLARTDDS